MSDQSETLFDAIGGEPTFRALVDEFYRRVEGDLELRAIFPEDMEPGKYHQYLFLMQYWGGPPIYMSERGHPRMRLRHAPYTITPDLSNRWITHMHSAIDVVGIQEPYRSQMRDYFESGATFLINRYQSETD